MVSFSSGAMAKSSCSGQAARGDPNWEYCGVKLTIHNIIIPEERLCPSPSQLDKMDPELEADLRIVGCELIQDSGVLLRLPQVAMATAQVLYQRFFYAKSFVRHFYEHYAMGCVFLAAKLEECPRRLRDIINVFHHIRQIREHKTPTPVMLDQSYSNLKNQVIKAERRILKELGFCVHAKHPHKLVICYIQALGQESNLRLVQTSWNYMNDSLRTDLFVRYLPEAIACACIYLASCKLGIPLPRHPAWWEMFTVDEESVREIALCLMRLYARPKPNIADLEAELAKLRKSQVEAKERELELKKQTQSANTPSSANSDHSSGNATPPRNQNDKAQGLSSDSGPRVSEAPTGSESGRQYFPPTSLLASALALTKPATAGVNIPKAVDVPTSSALRNFDINSNNEMTEELPLAFTRADASSKRRPSPGGRPHRHDRRNTEMSGFSSRPAAYPNVSPEDAEGRRKRRHKRKHSRHYSSRHPSVSLSSSTSSGSEDAPSHSVPSSAYNPNSRHYRHHQSKVLSGTNHSSSGSGTPESSPSPVKRRKTKNAYSHKKLIRRSRSRSRSSVTSNSSSTSSSVDSRHASDNRLDGYKRNNRSNHRRPSPPAAYRIDKTQELYNSVNDVEKSRFPLKMPAPNGNTRHARDHSRHRNERSDSSKKHHLTSHEHRRR